MASNLAKRVCIVGSGPAGFYSAQHLLKLFKNECRIDLFEKFPVPFGLVRYGVAPDHPDVRNVINKFNKVAENPSFRFFGNVEIGRDISVGDLKGHYDAVILAHGANQEKKLNVKGEDGAKNVVSARDLVAWYNGEPRRAGNERLPAVDFSRIETVTILGVGNVALDIARLLALSYETLRRTDIATEALDNLARSTVRRVRLMGRRGPEHVAFTVKEFRELTKMPHVRINLNRDDFRNVLQPQNGELVDGVGGRRRKRLLELMVTTMGKEFAGAANMPIDLDVKFFYRPVEVFDGKTRFLVQDSNGERHEDLEHDLLVKSIGYCTETIDESVPLVETSNGGRVVRNSRGHVDTNLFVAGWAGTGPVGVLLETMSSAFQTAQTVHDYLRTVEPKKPVRELATPTTAVDWQQWLKIDKYECDEGRKVDRPRVKVTDLTRMLEIAQS